MSKIVWDAAGTRKFEYGVEKGVLYPMGAEGTYEQGVPWNGLINVTDSPEGAEATALWADDIKYGVLRSAEDHKGSIEAYTYPPEFEACQGGASPEKAKGLVIRQQTRKAFGFCYTTKIGNDANSEAGYKIHIVYNCTVSPSEQSHDTTNDSLETTTFSWDYESTPAAITTSGYKPTSVLEIDSTIADAEKLKALEAKLYGDESEQPTLPTPDEVITLLSATEGP